MTTIVVLNISGTMIRVECDGLARDAVLPKNIVLTGCRELDTEARDGTALDTKLWSVPETVVLSYAMGRVATPAPVEAPAAAPETGSVVKHVWTEEEKAARRARYAARDEATRSRRAARKAKLAQEAAPAVETAAEPVPKKKGGRRKKATDPAP